MTTRDIVRRFKMASAVIEKLGILIKEAEKLAMEISMVERAQAAIRAARTETRKKKGGDSLKGKGKGKKPMKNKGTKNCD